MSYMNRIGGVTRYRAIKRLGFLGFSFFFVKGLLWLALANYAHSFL